MSNPKFWCILNSDYGIKRVICLVCADKIQAENLLEEVYSDLAAPIDFWVEELEWDTLLTLLKVTADHYKEQP